PHPSRRLPRISRKRVRAGRRSHSPAKPSDPSIRDLPGDPVVSSAATLKRIRGFVRAQGFCPNRIPKRGAPVTVTVLPKVNPDHSVQWLCDLRLDNDTILDSTDTHTHN